MGNRRGRILRLRNEHPVCYFCSTAATETEDHVPSRECFHGREGPEGFGFPACRNCNNSAGQFEQVVALYMILANYDDKEPSQQQLERLLQGVKNNNPDLMPNVEVNARAARTHFKQQGKKLRVGETYAGTPLLVLPVGNRDAFELFARRLACALFYRQAGKPVPLDYYIATAWMDWSHPTIAGIAEQFRNFLPEITMTNRVNTNIGDQFLYLWGLQPDHSIFAFAAQFQKSFLFFGAVAAPHLFVNMDDPKWKPHHSDVGP